MSGGLEIRWLGNMVPLCRHCGREVVYDRDVISQWTHAVDTLTFCPDETEPVGPFTARADPTWFAMSELPEGMEE